MIGSHDTYTYENPILSIWNVSKRLWKTQCKTIDEQYAYGIRMFDVRIARTLNGKWVACHGLVDFHKHWDSLDDICAMFSINYPEAIYRIVLEKGGKYAQKKFKKQASGLCAKYPNLWRIDIKSTKNWLGSVENNNQNLYDKGYKFALVNTWEPPCYEQHEILSLKNIFTCNLKAGAQKINQASLFKAAETAESIDSGKISAQKVLNIAAVTPIIVNGFIKPTADLESKDVLYFIDYCTNEYD